MKWILEKDLFYTETHEWGRLEGENVLVVGITDYAQDKLGGVVFVELPEAGESFSAGDPFGVVESVKTVSDLFMPIDGKIIEINEELEDSPEMVNEDPYGEGWMIIIEIANESQLEELMDSEAYQKSLE